MINGKLPLCSLIFHVPKLFAYTRPNKFLGCLDKIEHCFIAWRTPKEEQVSFAASRLSISAS